MRQLASPCRRRDRTRRATECRAPPGRGLRRVGCFEAVLGRRSGGCGFTWALARQQPRIARSA
eukprot:1141044-Alexandrium_andersonii.AAC.1